ncbi:hypothetical protein [Endothiovibrio diazotrophicus]
MAVTTTNRGHITYLTSDLAQMGTSRCLLEATVFDRNPQSVSLTFGPVNLYMNAKDADRLACALKELLTATAEHTGEAAA